MAQRLIGTPDRGGTMRQAQADYPQATRLAVLVVDDHKLLRELLREALEASGFAVKAAADGEEALLLLAREHYAAIVCDLLMPNMTGAQLFQVCERLHPEMTHRFIFLSGCGDGTEPSQAAAATGRPCLKKPCPLSELRSAIAAVTA